MGRFAWRCQRAAIARSIRAGLLGSCAWVIPDALVRHYVASILETHDHFAFGCPSAVFSNLSEAFAWLTRTAGRRI
jgi:hypothetical protein